MRRKGLRGGTAGSFKNSDQVRTVMDSLLGIISFL